jgi:DNA-binding HxlR family transcriptional regulator
MIVLLVLSKPHRFGELKRNIPDITEKVLITTLRDLEKAGMIHRQATLGKHLQTIYSLSSARSEKVQKISHSMADVGKGLE